MKKKLSQKSHIQVIARTTRTLDDAVLYPPETRAKCHSPAHTSDQIRSALLTAFGHQSGHHANPPRTTMARATVNLHVTVFGVADAQSSSIRPRSSTVLRTMTIVRYPSSFHYFRRRARRCHGPCSRPSRRRRPSLNPPASVEWPEGNIKGTHVLVYGRDVKRIGISRLIGHD